MSAPVRVPRGRRTTTSMIIAVLLLLTAVAAGYLAVAKALRRRPAGVDLSNISNWLQQTSWNNQALLIAGIAVAAVGALILAVALLPSRRRMIELANPDAHTSAALSKKGLRRTVAAAATGIDGISAAAAKIGPRRIALKVTSGLRHTDGLTQSAANAVTERVESLQLHRPRTVSAHLIRKES